MLSAPADLTDDLVADALARGWALSAARMAYEPVGWGSHHWTVVDASGTTWFATADDLLGRKDVTEPDAEPAYDRLRASLASAVALRDAGRAFVVAPVPTLDDQPLIRADHYGVSLYPFVAGQSFEWGQTSEPFFRAILTMLIDVHNAPIAVRRFAHLDTFTIPHRSTLTAPVPESGPYSGPTADLIAANRSVIAEGLRRYDELMAGAQTSRMVLTHGEPHPGNTMRTEQGWKLIDWDTVLVAPPERDLWSLEPLHADYAKATGVELVADMLELYRVRWILADIAVDVARFGRPHTTGPDEDQSWILLQENVASLA